jgi:prolyl-tRNA editing enzyme YbaK/EbsC (Cys-tRNA(Pro) deacylase)
MAAPGAAHPNVVRVADAARRAGLEVEIRRFPQGTRTAEDAARAVGCAVGQIVKSLVFIVDGDPVLVLVAGDNRLDPQRLVSALHAGSARRATGEEVRAATGFAIGGVPPLGHASPLTTVIDADLLRHERVWAAAGLPDAVFAVSPADLARATGAVRAEIAAGAGATGGPSAGERSAGG